MPDAETHLPPGFLTRYWFLPFWACCGGLESQKFSKLLDAIRIHYCSMPKLTYFYSNQPGSIGLSPPLIGRLTAVSENLVQNGMRPHRKIIILENCRQLNRRAQMPRHHSFVLIWYRATLWVLQNRLLSLFGPNNAQYPKVLTYHSFQQRLVSSFTHTSNRTDIWWVQGWRLLVKGSTLQLYWAEIPTPCTCYYFTASFVSSLDHPTTRLPSRGCKFKVFVNGYGNLRAITMGGWGSQKCLYHTKLMYTFRLK